MVVVAVVAATEVEEVNNSDSYYISVVVVTDTYLKNCYRWNHMVGSYLAVVVVGCKLIVEAKDTYSSHCYYWAYNFRSYMIGAEAVVVDEEEDIAEAFLIQAKEHDLWLKFLLILLVLNKISSNRLLSEKDLDLTKERRMIVSSKCLMLNL